MALAQEYGLRPSEGTLSKYPRLLSWLVIGALALLGVSALRIAGNRPTKEASSTRVSDLVVAPERLDFGEAWEDSQFKWVLPILNAGSHEVEIQDFGSSCTCSAIEPQSLVIPAGQAREVCLTLDLTADPLKERAKQPAQEWRDFPVTLAPRLRDDRGSRTWWTIKGRVHAAFVLIVVKWTSAAIPNVPSH